MANKDGKTMTAFCSNLLPREGIEGGSFYRYQPGESIEISAWSYINGGPTKFSNLSKLDGSGASSLFQLKGAVDLGFSLLSAAAVLAMCYF